jgi:hypothetical protein
MTTYEKTLRLVKIMLCKFSDRMGSSELDHLVVGIHPADFTEVWLEINAREPCSLYEVYISGVRVVPLVGTSRL